MKIIMVDVKNLNFLKIENVLWYKNKLMSLDPKVKINFIKKKKK